MNAQKIDQNKWKEFFDDFSRRNRSRIVSVEVLSEFGAQKEIKRMPLSGVVFENGKKRDSFLELMFENFRLGEGNHITHTIADVCCVFPKRNIDGRDEALEIEDSGGNKTLLIFEQLPFLGAGAFRAAASRRLW